MPLVILSFVYNYKYNCNNNFVVNQQWMPSILNKICSFFINIFIKLVIVKNYSCMYD